MCQLNIHAFYIIHISLWILIYPLKILEKVVFRAFLAILYSENYIWQMQCTYQISPPFCKSFDNKTNHVRQGVAEIWFFENYLETQNFWCCCRRGRQRESTAGALRAMSIKRNSYWMLKKWSWNKIIYVWI